MGARLILGAAGAAIGGYFGGPAGARWGFLIGAAIGGGFESNKEVQGPRLGDLKLPQATYGSPIAYIEGAWRTTGTIGWGSSKREIATTTTEGGKGGPGVDTTTYTYEMDLLIVLSSNVIPGVSRIWRNGELIWTALEGADGDSIDASVATAAWRDIRMYTGAPDQLPDPTYEAAVGVGNAPAYRGRGTIFIEGLDLGGGGQLPVLTFEIATGVSTEPTFRVKGYWSNSVLTQGTWRGAFEDSTVRINEAGSVIEVDLIPFQKPDAIPLEGVSSSLLTGGPAPSGSFTDLRAWRMSQGVYEGRIGVGYSDRTVRDDGNALIEASIVFNDIDWNTGETTFRKVVTQGFAAIGDPTPGDYLSSVLCAFDPVSRIFVATPTDSGKTDYEKLWFCRPSSDTFTTYDVSGLIPGPISDIAIIDGDVYTAHYVNARGACVVLKWPRNSTYVDGGVAWTDGAAAPAPILESDDSASVVSNNLRAHGGPLGLHVYTHGILSDDQQVQLLNADGSWTMVLAEAAFAVTVDGHSFAGSWAGGFHASTRRFVLATVSATGYGGQGIVDIAPFTTAPVPLDEVVSRLCLRTGLLTADDIDVTDLADQSLRGMAISQIGSARQAIETLMSAFLFEAVEGQKIKFVKRGHDPVMTIEYDRLGASEGEPGEPLPIKPGNDIEWPARVSIRFANSADDYQDGSVDGDRMVTQSTAVSVVELQIAMLPGEAKRLADASTMDLAVAMLGIGPIQLTRRFAALEPSDVLLVTDRFGRLYRARIQKITDGVTRQIELVADDPSAIESLALTDESYESSNSVRNPAATLIEYMDTPILRDADNDQGAYVVAKGAGTPWPGAILFDSRDGLTYERKLTVTESAVFGRCTTTLDDWTGPRVRDLFSTVTVDVDTGQLSSHTWDELLNDQTINACAIGVDGRWEICQFLTADLVDTGIYTLSGFLRGSRGTEWATTGHVADETFVLLRPSGMRRLEMDTSAIGANRYYRAVTIGLQLSGARTDRFQNMAIGLKPFSPFAVRAARNPSTHDIALTWQRRTRLAVRTIGPMGISVPLGEEAEAYAVDVYSDGTYTTLKRTLTVSTPTVTYTSAQQVADFGTNQSTVYLHVHQLSAVVGRGYPAEAAV
jgi:hypothetical protein